MIEAAPTEFSIWRKATMTDLDQVLARIDAERDNSLDRLFKFLSIKSISTDPAYADDCRTAAVTLAADLATLDLAAEVHPTDGHPIVFAKAMGSAPGRKRAVFYGHYDVQPVDPLDLWQTPPFEPRIATLPDGREAIVARGACDDKGQVMTFIEACRAFKAVTGAMPLDLTFVIEGEEECGSKHLPGWLAAHKAEIAGDIALVCDTGMWDPKTPAITTALRGLLYEEIKIKAADRDLHSGMFGGAAQNPIRVLAKIIAAIHDHDGRITIPGFYDGVKELPDAVREEWQALGMTPEKFLGQVGLGVHAGEKGRLVIEQVSSFLCPSDSNKGSAFPNNYQANGPTIAGASNYPSNIGMNRYINGGGVGFNWQNNGPNYILSTWDGVGSRMISMASFTDGTSQTAVFSEWVKGPAHGSFRR